MPLISYADMTHAPQEVREAFARMPRKLNVMKMLAKRPEDRYQTATELLGDLQVIADEEEDAEV